MNLRGFVEGGLASIVAGCSTHPLDVIKVRMQLEGADAAALQLAHSSCAAGPIAIGLRLVQTEGLQGLFCGVSATILRQTLYSTTRMGLYQLLKQQWGQPNLLSTSAAAVKGGATSGLPFFKKIAAGLIAGGVGAAVGNPADVAMVRMQADGLLPPEERRNYTSVVDALARMVKQEGVQSLWTGSWLTVQRAMVVTACQLAAYDQVKESLLVMSNSMRVGGGVDSNGAGGVCLLYYVVASCCAGVAASLVATPIDVVRTRIMMQPGGGAAGRDVVQTVDRPNRRCTIYKYNYRGPWDCAVKTVQQEGALALYKGFLPTLTRQGPFTVVLFVTLEQLRRLIK